MAEKSIQQKTEDYLQSLFEERNNSEGTAEACRSLIHDIYWLGYMNIGEIIEYLETLQKGEAKTPSINCDYMFHVDAWMTGCNLKAEEVLVVAYLNQFGEMPLTLADMVKKTGLSSITCIIAIDDLLNVGLLKKRKYGENTAIYTVNVEEFKKFNK